MPTTEKHLSKSFDNDLNTTLDLFMEMGRLAAEHVTVATHALIEGDSEISKQVILDDDLINQLEMKIDEQVVLLVAKRQPTASDLRLIIALSKGVVDLERVGDEAGKIAKMTCQLIENGGIPMGAAEVQHLSNQVRLMLLDALDAFARMDAKQALSVLQSDKDVDEEYETATRSLMTYVMEDCRQVTKVINLLWVLRALERIGDHARNLAEYVIYCTSGEDVRHTDFEAVEQAVQKSSDNNSGQTNN